MDKEAKKKQDKSKEVAYIPDVVKVGDFADKIELPVTDVISILMKNGVLATINDTIDFETAAIVSDDLGVEVKQEPSGDGVEAEIKQSSEDAEADLAPRPPVVTVMGHVDHGKTTLLDRIREAHIAETESGGITQHISAYQVKLEKTKKKDLDNKTITFIDTPGHAAFSAVRSHGATITDIVILIVAADDGVMPQTEEVINQIKLNKVPVVVAINKVDLPEADVMKTKQQLADHDLVSEEWGGDTVMVEVSAKTGKNIDDLLEMVLLQADLMELKANPDRAAVGVVIESHMHKGAGALALVLVENGTLGVGDPVQIGSTWGKVRILEDYNQNPIDKAPPSFPARVAGLKSLPDFGERLVVFESEKKAKQAAQETKESRTKTRISTAKKVGIEDVAEEVASGERQSLNLIIKADVNGSLQAIKQSLADIDSKELNLQIVTEGIGPISESDITMAKASDAMVFGFRVSELFAAQRIAEKEGVPVETYDVIYELIDDVKGVLSGMLSPEIIEKELGKGTVKQIFRDDKNDVIAGAILKIGKIEVGDKVKILQDDNEKWRGEIKSLRREKDQVKEVTAGQEFGFGLEAGAKIASGDQIVAFEIEKRERKVE